jgi:FAD-dependent oxidoreductase family protein
MLSRGVGRVAARVVSETLSSTPPPPPSLSCAAPASAPSSTTTPDAGRIHSTIPPARLHHQVSRYSQASRPDPSSHAETSHPPPPPPPRPPRRSSRKLIALTLILTTSGTAYYLLSPDALPTDRVLNTERFTPFDLIARETVSPTSFILTLRPSPTTFSSLSPPDIAAQLADPWARHDLWAVEVKQPQLQIARDYTPLNPSPDQDPTTIRLWIRAVDGGETSTYLSRLPVGSKVELRGPRGSFDLSSRLGVDRAPAPPSPPSPPSSKRRKWDKARNREVVFLAGGTGIATALQAAHSLLETAPGSPPSPATRVRILWAVRSQSDVQQTTSPAVWTVPAPPARPPPLSSPRTWWSFLTGSSSRDDAAPAEISSDFTAPTALTRQILDLKARHGDRLSAHFVVDDEGSYISAATVLAALGGPAAAAAATGTDERRCVFHSQALHARMSDGAPNAGRRDLARREDCGCPGEGRPGKDLALVSGPDGFIAAYAGAKQWEAGGQVQGAVGGVLGELERRHPGLLKDWIVLKL